ncbi:hypothetical protein N7G274_005795 [Stereocaulon virgatum]|uniref:Uncharacterized protein n=1 Tax=Stereocaulon virgatum TaxID=373712 RepID=A0ABR4A6V8_9LECA
MSFTLPKRQTVNGDYGAYNNGWGDSNTAIAIKWAFVGAIVLLFLLWFIGGYYHAQSRIKKGLPPLAYHRWLLPHRQRVQYMPRPQFGYYPQQNAYGEGYPMQNFAPPPPAYNHADIPPPVYQPPENGMKVNQVQEWAATPPGPLPNHLNMGESSNTMQNVPLNQAASGQQNLVPESPVQPARKGMMSRLNPFSK